MTLTQRPRELATAKAGFILQGTTLRGWCVENGVDPGYAHKALAGRLNGPGAVKLRSRIIEAAVAEQLSA